MVLKEPANYFQVYKAPMGTERAGAVVVLYQPDAAILAQLAEGLRGHRLIAVANGPISVEATDALAGADLRLEANPGNLGLGAALDQGMRAAAEEGFSHALLLDQDSRPPPDLLEALRVRMGRLAEEGERVGVVAAHLTPPAEGNYRPIRYAWRHGRSLAGCAPVDFAPTSGSLTNLAAYAEVGPFRRDFFIAGIDVEWGFRAWSRRWGSYVVRDLAMQHRWGEATRRNESGRPQILRHASVRNYYYARNVVATARLPHVPARWRAASLAMLAAQIGLLALRGAPGALRPIRTGLRDGLIGRLGPAPETLA
jgi:rhamnosyltransferase